MKREDKVISLELAKEIDKEHKRLSLEVESEWWWAILKGGEAFLQKMDKCPNQLGVKICYPAYDTSELGEILLWRDVFFPYRKGKEGIRWNLDCYRPREDTFRMEYNWQNAGRYLVRYTTEATTEAECRGKMYLWLLKEGYIQ